ncbi:MAG: right-handed parallel beta-helix repeat-containing protein [Pirellulales bacterium]
MTVARRFADPFPHRRRKRARWSPRVEGLEPRQLLAVVVVDTNLDQVDGNTSSISSLLINRGVDQKISLREAILATNKTSGQDEIQFSETVFTATDGVPDRPIVLNRGTLSVTEQLLITGLGPNRTKIDGANSVSLILDLKEPERTGINIGFLVEGLWITGSTGVGLSIYGWNSNSIAVNNSRITDNGGRGIVTGGYWGGITNFTITNSSISGNRGGGLSTRALRMVNSQVSGNSSPGPGGGIYLQSGSIAPYGGGSGTIENSQIVGNHTTNANSGGGGIYCERGGWSSGQASLVNSTVAANYTIGDNSPGGGIYGNVIAENSTLAENYTRGASSAGGGIYGNLIRLTNSSVGRNSTAGANSPGGGVYFYKYTPPSGLSIATEFTASSAAFNGNLTEGNDSPGGAVGSNDLLLRDNTITIESCEFRQNKTLGARSPGGALRYMPWESTATIVLTTFSDNQTTGDQSPGGAISSGPLKMSQSTISRNSTSGSKSPGGGIIGEGSASRIEISQCTIASNSTSGSQSSGGGIWTRVYDGFVLLQSTVAANSTHGPSSPGGGLVSHWVTEITGSVVAANSSQGAASDVLFPELQGRSLTRNLIGTNAGTTLNPAPLGHPDAKGNYIGTAVAPIDPRLRPLANNGGPTQTMAPYATSPLVDAGSNPQNLLNDQRGIGFKRVVGGAGDIGAVELQQGAARTADTDFDGDVDSADLANLLAGWTGALPQYQGTQGQAQGDTDADGDTDSADLLEMLAQWTSAVAAGSLSAPTAAPRPDRTSTDQRAERTTPLPTAARHEPVSLLPMHDASPITRGRKPSPMRARK